MDLRYHADLRWRDLRHGEVRRHSSGIGVFVCVDANDQADGTLRGAAHAPFGLGPKARKAVRDYIPEAERVLSPIPRYESHGLPRIGVENENREAAGAWTPLSRVRAFLLHADQFAAVFGEGCI